jgi:hypothetical protein
MEHDDWLITKSALFSVQVQDYEAMDLGSRAQHTHITLLECRREYLSKRAGKRKLSLVYAPSKIAAANPTHESSEVADSSVRIRVSYSACDCFVAMPSSSEYMNVMIWVAESVTESPNLKADECERCSPVINGDVEHG